MPESVIDHCLECVPRVTEYQRARLEEARAELSDLRARLATATELLREMRFCDVHFERTGNIVKCCAICKHYRDKHAPDCRLAAFLEGAKLADNPEAKA